MGKNKNKRPKAGAAASSEKIPRIAQAPESWNKERPAWQLSRLDMEGQWGWHNMDRDTLLNEIHSKLRDFESMTWGEILQAAGGRTAGTNHHHVELERLCKDARDRLSELQLDDLDQLFSLRLTGERRIWGIREGRVLRVLWYDAQHAVCPTAN